MLQPRLVIWCIQSWVDLEKKKTVLSSRFVITIMNDFSCCKVVLFLLYKKLEANDRVRNTTRKSPGQMLVRITIVIPFRSIFLIVAEDSAFPTTEYDGLKIWTSLKWCVASRRIWKWRICFEMRWLRLRSTSRIAGLCYRWYLSLQDSSTGQSLRTDFFECSKEKRRKLHENAEKLLYLDYMEG